MTGLATATLRRRWAAFAGMFVALALGVGLVTGTLLLITSANAQVRRAFRAVRCWCRAPPLRTTTSASPSTCPGRPRGPRSWSGRWRGCRAWSPRSRTARSTPRRSWAGGRSATRTRSTRRVTAGRAPLCARTPH
ncbi:hypothetical protein ACFQX7_35440 [Luedemannella flava]